MQKFNIKRLAKPVVEPHDKGINLRYDVFQSNLQTLISRIVKHVLLIVKENCMQSCFANHFHSGLAQLCLKRMPD